MRIFKKKLKGDLEQAEAQGLITREEMLRLKCERADTQLKQHLEKYEGHKKKRK